VYVITNIHITLRLKTDQHIYKYEYNNLDMTSIDPSKMNANGGAVYVCCYEYSYDTWSENELIHTNMYINICIHTYIHI
jgi:hypothetical protein